ncbi:MAG: NADP-dependent isocitrate dehydrogenase [Lachnospiraceae bacterium]|nr:NADP-dependent isocitrate dehydrogenase [Lachnospiraceae bacterium]
MSELNSAKKINMANPIVELDGDEMTRIIWDIVKKELILPYVDLNTVYYDLGLENRDKTDDQVTIDAANAIKKYRVGVKCATITPNAFRMEEYKLKRMYKSPNGTLREILDGTVFRTPITVNCVKPCVSNWVKPITIARHAYGDLYSATESKIDREGTVEVIFTDKSGKEEKKKVFTFEGGGVIQCQYNTEESITKFAKSCFNYAVDMKQDLWFSAKDTISKVYDQLFKETFDSIFENEYKEKFDELGIKYFYTLIDDAVSRVMHSEGGFIWACKNYDGDVMSDMVASAFGALAMMTSVLVSPDGCFEYEAAHGTVQRHYYRYREGEKTSTNSVATIFAWAGAFKKRGQLDGNDALVEFGEKLIAATVKTIESGKMTKDLAAITTFPNPTVLNTEEFILAIKENL